MDQQGTMLRKNKEGHVTGKYLIRVSGMIRSVKHLSQA